MLIIGFDGIVNIWVVVLSLDLVLRMDLLKQIACLPEPGGRAAVPLSSSLLDSLGADAPIFSSSCFSSWSCRFFNSSMMTKFLSICSCTCTNSFDLAECDLKIYPISSSPNFEARFACSPRTNWLSSWISLMLRLNSLFCKADWLSCSMVIAIYFSKVASFRSTCSSELSRADCCRFTPSSYRDLKSVNIMDRGPPWPDVRPASAYSSTLVAFSL